MNLKEIIDKLSKFLRGILRVLLLLMVFITFLQVIMRYIFNSPLTWAEEIIGVLMIYFGLIGGSFGIYYGIHISLEIFVERFIKKWDRYIRIFEIVIYLFFAFIEVVYGVQIMKLTVFQVLPATGFPVRYTYIALPISGVIMIIYSIVLLGKLGKEGPYESGTSYTIR